MGCKASTLLPVKDGTKANRPQGRSQGKSSGVSYTISRISTHRREKIASMKAGLSKIHLKFSSVRVSTPSTSPGTSPRKGPLTSAAAEHTSISSQAIDDADQAECCALEEIKSHALCRSPPQTARQHGGNPQLHTGDDCIRIETLDHSLELPLEEEPSKRQLKAVWFLMKINAATDSSTKIKWMHDLEWLLVSLDPLERKQPDADCFSIQTRSVLVEAKAIELCVESIKETPEDLPLCVSCLAILVHLSLAKEASSRLLGLEGIEIISAMLKKYFQNCKKLITLLSQSSTETIPTPIIESEELAPTALKSEMVTLESPTGKPTVSFENVDLAGSEDSKSEQKNSAENHLQTQCASNEDVCKVNEAATEAPSAAPRNPSPCNVQKSEDSPCEGELSNMGESDSTPPLIPPSAVAVPQTAVFRRMVSYLKAGKRRTSCGDETQSSAQQEQWTRDLKLTIEFITLVWRLIFATSLDGDVFAQRWVSAGAADVALEAIASKEPLLNDGSFVCWSLGALRFMPLANPNLSQSLVIQKGLLKFVIDKMKDHLTDPLVLENGFAVLANFQRRQPMNAVHFHNQCPQAWANSVFWLDRDESVMRLDVLFQGLFALGLACSYCPDAALSVKAAGGLLLAERVIKAYSESARDRSTSSSTDSKMVTLQQFAEGLKVLLMKLVEEESANEETVKGTSEHLVDSHAGDQCEPPVEHDSGESANEFVEGRPNAKDGNSATVCEAPKEGNCLNEEPEMPEENLDNAESAANPRKAETQETETACNVTDDTKILGHDYDAAVVSGEEGGKVGTSLKGTLSSIDNIDKTEEECENGECEHPQDPHQHGQSECGENTVQKDEHIYRACESGGGNCEGDHDHHGRSDGELTNNCEHKDSVTSVQPADTESK